MFLIRTKRIDAFFLWRLKLRIIGNGMVARAFTRLIRTELPVILFASGVSNSQCCDYLQFERERALLLKSLTEVPTGYKLVYISTCSIYDDQLSSNPYVIHKSAMERLVLSSTYGLVIRLPQLVGKNAPPSTLVRFLVEKIKAGEPVSVWRNAKRNIIDIEDVVRIAELWLLGSQRKSRVINIANPSQVSILGLVNVIETSLDLIANIKYSQKGSAYDIDTSEADAYAQSAGVIFESDYLHNTIIKYFK